ncbi:MAG: hypothetical protein J6A61_07910 [Clostridia bacterium]|nr:hypothetical protein [Clostridia bacterium]
MKQDSLKKSLLFGIMSGAISFLVYVLLVVGAGLLTGWQPFFGADFTLQKIGGYSWEICAAVGVILFSFVPVCTLRYEKVTNLLVYLLISLLSVLWLYGSMLGVWMLVNPSWCPFTTLDAICYLAFAVPVGSVVGTVVAVVIHIMSKD